ncbi:hypothetical protein MHM88_11185 [Epibacterium sp. MM17-32]|uniref:hypothetical protein n=1 Tax=Epibacterium sp. MM17-32 TaxID=2917734 RepID=UPI001EF51868|nr:hypothetical protein [Epibacterium sp. MM17-32]MCG7628371.1 hypothetical protein [Epibacterium sp. MM17-32]
MAKRDQIVTPKGVFKFAHLNSPDHKGAERFGGDPMYKVTLVLDKEDAAPLIKKLEPLLEAAREAGVEKMDEAPAKTKASWKKRKISEPEVNDFYDDELDEDGEPTGRVEFKFKTKAEFTDNKTGKTSKRTVPFRDGKGQIIPMKKRPLVYGGTIGKIAFATNPVFIPKDAAVFLGLYLNEIQISQLSTGGSTEDPFGADEDSDFDADDLEEYEGNVDDADDDGDLDGDDGDDQDDGGQDLDDDEIPF